MRLFFLANAASPLTPRCVLSLCEVRQSARQRRKSQSALLASHSHSTARCSPLGATKASPDARRVLETMRVDRLRSTPISPDRPLRSLSVAFALNSRDAEHSLCVQCPMYVQSCAIDSKNAALFLCSEIRLRFHRASPSFLTIDRPKDQSRREKAQQSFIFS